MTTATHNISIFLELLITTYTVDLQKYNDSFEGFEIGLTFFSGCFLRNYIRVFHNLGNNANIDIRGFIM